MPKKKSKRQGAGQAVTETRKSSETTKSSDSPRRRKQEMSESEEQDSQEEELAEIPLAPPALYRRDLYWGPKDRPTHFLAVRLTDPELLKSIQTIHQQILTLEPTYAECLIPIERLHVTLGNIKLAESPVQQGDLKCNEDSLHTNVSTMPSVIHGDTCHSSQSVDSTFKNNKEENQTIVNIDEAIEILERLEDELTESASNLSVKLRGFGEFFNSTLYAKVADEDGSLRNWAERLCGRLREEGITFAEVFDFNPHITLLKITRSMAFKLRTRYIDGRILSALEGLNVTGEQRLSKSGIYLCEKSSKFSDDGFYITPAYLSLEGRNKLP